MHTINEAKERIYTLTDIKRSPGRILSFMRKHGFSLRKIGHIPAKADAQKQHQWIEQQFEPALKRAREGLCHLLFIDAAHFVFSPFVCPLWCVVRMFIKAPAGRQKTGRQRPVGKDSM